ncbi:MAG: hypothetical protein KBD29_01925 [Candidatus Magasanikbacteria bacterium]|nr:hypothetical protein [Candidatus Magasanikbacteria bacterium]
MTRFFARVSARVGQAYIKLFPNTLKKRTWWPVFGVGVLLIAVLSVSIVSAQAELVAGLLNGLVEVIARILIELSKLCIFLTIFFLRAFITLASYNNFIDVSVVKLGWVMVRDVANMFFIVGLLVIAFATILGFESYEWKHGLVKIVLMAILINFSNLIAQLVIDVAHIFTITFLNAVSATAGGNLITMFQMDKILELAQSSPSELGATRDVASLTLFAGSVLAFIFALLAALTIGAYMVVMIFRIVVLWALIVLSPLAFMLYAIPKGEKYASEWWSEFSKHVIVAPIMVFFLWLAFATLGTGQIISEIQSGDNVIQLTSSGQEQKVTVLEISTWENFASFLLGIGFLWVGIKKTEETGATGAGLVGSALDFTKNVATIATGYAAGRWLVGGAAEKVKSDFPVIGGKSLARKGMMIKGAYNYAKSKTGIGRDSKVQDWEKNLKEAVQKGKVGDILKFGALRFGVGGFIASSKKKDAVAETWEEKAHMADEEHEARISNSGTLGGTGKDEQRIRTELAVKLKDAKGAQKGAEGLLALKEKDDQVNDDLNKIADTEILGHKAEERLHAEEEEHHMHAEDNMRTKGEGELKKYLDAENDKRVEAKKSKMTQEEQDEFVRENFRDFKGVAKYAALSRGLKGIQVRNERHKEALDDEEKEKKEKERLKQSRKNADFKSYDDRSTKAGLKYESVKGVYDSEAKKGTAETFEKLMKDSSFKAEQEEQARLSGEVKALEDKKTAEKELLALEEIRKILAAGGLDATLQAQARLEDYKEKDEYRKIETLGEARAAYYEKLPQPDHVRAQIVRQQAAAQILKKESELTSNLSFHERRALEQQTINDIHSAPARGVPADEIRRLQRRQVALANANIASDAETSVAARQQAAVASGINEINDKNRLLVELKRLTGSTSDDIPALVKEFDSMFTDATGKVDAIQRDQIMRTLSTSYKSVAFKGDEGGVGLIREVVRNGKVEYDWEQNVEELKKAKTYFAATSKLEAGVEGYATQVYTPDSADPTQGSWDISGFDDRGGASFAQAMKSKDARAFAGPNMQRLHEQMERAVVNQANVGSYIATLSQAKANMGNGGFKESKKAWKRLYDNIERVTREKIDATSDIGEKSKLENQLKEFLALPVNPSAKKTTK